MSKVCKNFFSYKQNSLIETWLSPVFQTKKLLLLSQSSKPILYVNLQSTLLQVYEGLLAWTQLNDMSYTMGPSVYT